MSRIAGVFASPFIIIVCLAGGKDHGKMSTWKLLCIIVNHNITLSVLCIVIKLGMTMTMWVGSAASGRIKLGIEVMRLLLLMLLLSLDVLLLLLRGSLVECLIAILLLAEISAKIIAIYYINIIWQWSQPYMVQWSSTAPDGAILTNGPGFECGESQLEFEVRHVPIVLFL